MRPTFCGCSVRQFNAQAGWGLTGLSQLSVSLVQDASNGDVYVEPTVGAPAYFSYQDFSFGGLVKNAGESGSIEGYLTYDVVLVDPREILAGAQVILGAYTGATSSAANVLSPFGWWEAQGFGLAQADESGMPWFRIALGLTALLGQPLQTTYGGPLQYRGYTYGLDLSEVPTPPADYRIGSAVSISLLELIAIVCEDGGYDFTVDLVGSTIRVRTVSRRAAPPLGTLQAVAEAHRGIDLIRYQRGVESRTEPTSVILFGAEKKEVHQALSLTSFWGYDVGGQPITGTPGRLDLIDSRYYCTLSTPLPANGTSTAANTFTEVVAGQVLDWSKLAAPFELLVDNTGVFQNHPPAGAGYADTSRFEVIRVNQSHSNVLAQPTSFFASMSRGRYGSTPVAVASVVDRLYLSYGSVLCEFMRLNSSPVADIVGSTSYATNTFELRLAKGNFNAWAVYLAHYRTDVATLVGILSPFKNKKGPGDKLPVDLIDDSSQNALKAAAALNADAQAKVMRLYEWLRGYADEYMGRKYLAPLPAVSYARDSETGRLRSSYEIDDGGWLDEGVVPLGVPSLMQDAFKTPDNRWRAFVRYSNILGADTSLVSPESTVVDVDNERFFSLVDVDPSLVLTSPTPSALLTIPGPLMDPVIDSLGDADLLKATLQLTQGEADKVFAKASFGNLGIKVSPACKTPDAAIVPLKSNVETYGPWVAAGVPGPARVDSDPGMAPWFFGSSALMERAGRARVDLAIMNALAVETGLLELAGAPTASLADTLADGGPPITGVQMTYGQAITTTYQFQTFTPRFGIFARNLAERLKRVSLAQAQGRRAARSVVKAAQVQGVQTAAAAKVVKAFQEAAPKVLKKQSPHEMLVAECYADQSLGRVRTGVSSLTLEETVGAVSAENASGYRGHAAMSWSGLVRPFSTQIPASGLTPPSGMPQYSNLPNWASGGIGRDSLDPWKSANDVEAYAWGQSYQGLTGSGRIPTDARPIALRGPVVLTGFGYDTEGYPVPGNGLGQFNAGHLTQPETWKCGPVDSLWDQRRGVWTSHDVLKGKVKTQIAASLGSGLVQVWHQGSGIPWDVSAYNWSGTALSSGTNVHLLFNVLDRRWYAHSAEAASGTSSVTASSGGIQAALWNVSGSGPVSGVVNLQNLFFNHETGFSVASGYYGGESAFYVSIMPATPSSNGLMSWQDQQFGGKKEFLGEVGISGGLGGFGSLLVKGTVALNNALAVGDTIAFGTRGPTPNGYDWDVAAGIQAGSGYCFWTLNGAGHPGNIRPGIEMREEASGCFLTLHSYANASAPIAEKAGFRISIYERTFYGASGTSLTGDEYYGGIVHRVNTDPAAARSALGIGSIAEYGSGDFLVAANNLGDVPDKSAARTALQLVPGTDVQVYNADLKAIADATSGTDQFPYYTSPGAAALATLTSKARELLACTTAAEMRTVLEI